ncbi:MAG: methyltransferase domain-containing protein [Acidimicrobiales bacterium]
MLTATYRRSPALMRMHPAGRATAAPSVVLRTEDGDTLDMDLTRWHDPATIEEQELLSTVDGPVIDLGCGPGRLVVSLAEQLVPALGVDSSPSAIALARARGATVMQQDLFEPLPGEGRWATALLFDGNVGIGGDPTRLLSRCRELMTDDGQVLAEVQPPGTRWRRLTAWFELDGHRSQSFAWAVVGADAIAEVSRPAGLRVAALGTTPSGRWFARLHPAP